MLEFEILYEGNEIPLKSDSSVSDNPDMLAWTPRLMGCAAMLLAVLSTQATTARPQPGSPSEIRAIWVTRWDFRTETDVRRAVRWPAALGINRVFLQVRGRADAFYRSKLEPWGEEIGGRDPGFDPLAVAIDEARQQGVELHAWINVMPGWKGEKSPRNRSHILYKHPEWFLTDKRGQRHLRLKDKYTILNPCLPEVRSYLVRVVRDLASRYAIDGLHLDYIRFVNRFPEKGWDYPYDRRTLGLFRSDTGSTPAQSPSEWSAWRRDCLSRLVGALSWTARKARPDVTVSMAAIGNLRRGRELFFQDATAWQKAGWVKEIFPMTYAEGDSDFRALVRPALATGRREAVFPGIGVYRHTSSGQLTAQIKSARQLGAGGYALFAFTDFFPSASHEYRDTPAACQRRAAMRRALFALNRDVRVASGK